MCPVSGQKDIDFKILCYLVVFYWPKWNIRACNSSNQNSHWKCSQPTFFKILGPVPNATDLIST